MIINFKSYSDDNFCKRCLIRAKQLMLCELDDGYRELIVLPEKERDDDKQYR